MELICDTALAAYLSISRRKIWDMNARDSLPIPVRLGRSVRWRKEDIDLWVEQGCPDRKQFEKAKRSLKKGPGNE